jgi:hypothetical protein
MEMIERALAGKERLWNVWWLACGSLEGRPLLPVRQSAIKSIAGRFEAQFDVNLPKL